ncbi:MAG: DNA translocase FtsK [Phycisphaerales bacterium]|nr:DNA translocase FtsK [Phycisphaerales bacterium]
MGQAKKKRGGGVEGASVARRAVLLVLIAGWAFVAASLIGFDPADPPSHLEWPGNSPVANWCGPFGARVAYGLLRLFGWGAWALVVLGGFGLLAAAAGQTVKHPLTRLVGLLLVAVSLAGLQRLMFPTTGAFPDLAGGLVGTVGTTELFQRFGMMGTFLWLSVLCAIGLVVAFDDWLGWVFGWMRSTGVPVAAELGKEWGAKAGEVAGEAAVVAAKSPATGTVTAGGGLIAGLRAMFKGRKPVEVRLNDLDDDAPSEEKARRATRARRARVEVEAAETIAKAEEVLAGTELEDGAGRDRREDEAVTGRGKKLIEIKPIAKAVEEAAKEEDHDLPGAPQVYDEAALRAKIAKLPVVFGATNRQLATEDDLRDLQNVGEMEGYRFPGLDLLENPEENFTVKLEEYVREQAQALESALRQYKIDGEVVGIESGPVITLYDVRLAPGTKVAAVEAVDSDIARALKAVNIRIVANQVGRDTIGIEVPNAQKEKVRLKELMGKTEIFSKMKLPMFLGKDASGESLIADLTQMPHMLIAGTTGSGKSVCMNTIIMGFLYTRKPNELKLVLVDPKMVEMSQFKDIPHLMCPVVTEMGKAAAILEWACGKMDERYELLAEAGVRDIAAYNDLPWEELKDRFNPKSPEEEARIPRKLPYMVFVIDELADLMMTAKEVESHIIRIAQKARAVGIHLILATQRPQANVVTGLIKSNMPARISFKVASGMDSRIVLDHKGGELLLGHGDMLFLSPRTSKLTRAQGTLVDDQETRRVVRFMREVAAPTFERSLVALRRADSDEERILQSQNNSSASLAAAQEDPMFERAVEIVLETRRGSVSLLQRRLAIGYTRSSRLIDLMGIAGIISDHKGSVARDVLITPEDWAMMKQMAQEEARAKGIEWPVKAAGEQQALFVEPKGEAAPGAERAEGPAVATPAAPGAEPVGAVEESEEEEAPWEEEEEK